MEHAYFSSFPAGFGEITQQTLKEEIHDVQIKLSYEGLVAYETTATPEKISQLKFFSNSFLLLKMFENTGNEHIEGLLKKVIDHPETFNNLAEVLTRKNRYFRVIAARENQLVSINKEILAKIEEIISQTTGLEVDRSNPDIEFWVMKRSEDKGFFGLRITKHPSYEKILQRGELRPEIAYLLNFLSEPAADDVFLDPFAGWGAIPRMRLAMTGVKKIIACDKKEIKVEGLEIKYCDALNLKTLSDQSVDKIVTDPPWGIFQGEELNLEDFYPKMIKELARVLKNKGIMVILTAQSELLEKVISEQTSLKIVNKYHVLISGKKAVVYKITSLSSGRAV